MRGKAIVSVLISVVLLTVAGCATTSKGPSDEEMISSRVQEGLAAFEAKNWDAFDSYVSPSFESYLIGNKEDLLSFLKSAEKDGYLEDIKTDFSEAVISVQGDEATYAPVTASGNFGFLSINFKGVKENGVWLISDLDPGF